MACYSPWESTDAGGGSRLFACGRCHGCKLEYARQWAVRCMHEASLHDLNCFITLTYRDFVWSLVYRDFQLFIKRLRSKFKSVRFGFYMSGEYSEINSRAHFHACLFGLDFPDRVYLRTTPAGSKLYRSAILESVWTHGFSSVGEMNFASAAYCARYCMDKLCDGSPETGILEILDPDSGEVYKRVKEFSRMSLRPAVGKNWFAKFRSDVYPSGKVVVNGVEARAPKYYDVLYRRLGYGRYMDLCTERRKDAGLAFRESLPGRIEPRAAVSKARALLSKRVV